MKDSTEEFVDTKNNDSWIARARRAYSDSTNYYETTLNRNWRDNIANFRSQHPPDSKYYSKNYGWRSKIFRPKTRTMERTKLATFAAAMFTNNDLIDVSGENKGDPLQAVAARMHKAILQHRLSKTIPWYLTMLGAFQDTNVYGICVTKQYWEYKESISKEVTPAYDENGQLIRDEEGVPLGYEEEVVEVIQDRPWIKNIPPDNFRYDPNADWRDPVNTSPYLIELIPMYAVDVMEMMKDTGNTHEKWIKYDLDEIITSGFKVKQSEKSVKLQRENERVDPEEINMQNRYKVVWVHFYIMKDEKGVDYAFYTLGTKHYLTKPKRLTELFRHGRELYRVGVSNVEAHRAFPDGSVGLIKALQKETNDIANQRMDNVRLILNKRYVYKRNADIDLNAVMRNVPGGGFATDNINEDVKVLETPDITGSSLNEHDRLNVETDALAGTFSQSSVQSNRSLNETVGGMNLMNAGANQVQELEIVTFIKTWAVPVLQTLVKLEAWYETDEVLMGVAQREAQEWGSQVDKLFETPVTVDVNVGMNNTDPQRKIERVAIGLRALDGLPELKQRLNVEELGREIFPNLGWGDGSRFLLTDEQLQKRQEQMPPQEDPRVSIAKLAQETKLKIAEMDGQIEQMRIQAQDRRAEKQLALQEGITVKQLEARLKESDAKSKTARDIEAARLSAKTREMNIKERTGTGI